MTRYNPYLYDPFMDMFLKSIDRQLGAFIHKKVEEGAGEHAQGLFLTCSGYNWNNFCDMMDGEIIPRLNTIISFPLSVGIRFEEFYDLSEIKYARRRRVRKRFPMGVRHSDLIKNVQEYLPRRIRFINEYLGYNEEDMLNLHWVMHMQYVHWKYILDGRLMPSIKAISILCQEYEVSLETLLGLDEWIYPWERTRNLQGI